MATAAPEVPSLVRDRAFEALYRRHVKDVYHYALALLRNPADAEDVTQTTFMNAYRAFKRGDQIEKPQNWLIKIAHNAARTRYARASRRVNEVPLDDHLEQLAVPEAERPDVRAVLDALGDLPLNQRAALVMRELEGRPYAEIADTLGVSVAAVETLIFRARRSLRVKASAIRVLSAVPVPGSLAQLVGAGGIAAGGGAGAIAGSGFVLKAAVLIVAGVVATGINSDRPTGAHAASASAAANASTSDVSAAQRKSEAATLTPERRAGGAERSARGAPRQLQPGADPATADSPAPSVHDTGGAVTTGATTSVSPAQAAARPNSNPAGTLSAPVQAVSSTADSVTTALPVQSPVPVSVPLTPQLPPPPLPVPSLPSPPPLPSTTTTTLPSLP